MQSSTHQIRKHVCPPASMKFVLSVDQLNLIMWPFSVTWVNMTGDLLEPFLLIWSRLRVSITLRMHASSQKTSVRISASMIMQNWDCPLIKWLISLNSTSILTKNYWWVTLLLIIIMTLLFTSLFIISVSASGYIVVMMWYNPQVWIPLNSSHSC